MSNFISLEQGIALTKKYRAEKENILAPEYQGKAILPICETFDRDSFQALLNETDCTYIRIYLGMGEDMNVRILAVGANSKEEDILPNAKLASSKAAAADGDGDGNIVEDGMRCPTICPPPSDLNT